MGIFGSQKKKSSSSGFGLLLVIGVAGFAISKNPSALHQFEAAMKSAGASVSHVSGTYSCGQLEQLWKSQGGSSSSAFLAAEVARAESGGIASQVSSNTNGTVDRGLWQINSSWGSLSTTNPAANARSAITISHNGTNWNPWVTYQKGLENGQC